ncbi:MAG: phage tail protein [Desulfobacterales bacterium]|nr:phage tail protein [Desulfobacterales bacterium]
MSGNPNLIAGILYLKVDGEMYRAKGDFTYNLGIPKREGLVGSDGVHGFKEVPQVPFIEGAITDMPSLDLEKFCKLNGVNTTLELANGKVITLREAWYAGEGTVNTSESEIPARFEGMGADEVK